MPGKKKRFESWIPQTRCTPEQAERLATMAAEDSRYAADFNRWLIDQEWKRRHGQPRQLVDSGAEYVTGEGE